VPTEAGISGPSNAAATIEVRRILAATDFSEASLTAARHAAQLARQFSAQLVLAHAVEPLTVPEQWTAFLQDSAEIRAADARDRLKSLAEQLSPAQDCESAVAIGRAADVIGSLAEQHGTQLIVMGLASAGGAFTPRPGSIAYRVLSSISVPVLVVPVAHA
jgi:nucleotide-binding universal stress UspA family protein